MGGDPLDELVRKGSAALGPPLAAGEGELAELLGRANGFYAFVSALHVLPSGTDDRMSLERWNSDDLWRREYDGMADGLVFFAEDVFGVQFALAGTSVVTFEPETGEVQPLAPDLRAWAAAVLADHPMLTGYPLAHKWQTEHGALPQGQRLVPKVPFVLGGAYAVDNLAAMDATTAMSFRASVAVQIRDLPDGATIRLRVTD
jgi:hypothetical protein